MRHTESTPRTPNQMRAAIQPLTFLSRGPNHFTAERHGVTYEVEHVADRLWCARKRERFATMSTVTLTRGLAIDWCNDRAWTRAKFELALADS